MPHPSRVLLGLAAGALVAAATLSVATSAAAAGKTTLSSNDALGLGDDGTTLRIFELNDPGDDDRIGKVTGLAGDSALIGIDYRVQDDRFYGVGDDGGIYTLNTKTAGATKVSQLTVPLDGTRFDIDFNPAADRLRIISDTGQNLRHNVAGTTTTDGELDYAAVTAQGVTGAAYTNNDVSAETNTALFDVDANLDQVAIQLPPNDGSLTQIGKLGISVSQIVGFDIQSKVSSSRTVTNTGFASLRTSDGGEPHLYRVDVLSGKVTEIGDFDKQIADIAVKQP